MKGFPSFLSIFISAFIIGIAPWARKILRFIYSHIGRDIASNWLKIFFIIGGVIVIFYVFHRWKKIQTSSLTFLLFLPLIPFTILFFKIVLPEEKIHLILYALLGLSLFNDFAKGKVKLLLGTGFIILMAFLDELFQLILPDRYFDYRDIFFNCVGGFTGFSMGKFFISKKGE